MELPNYPNRTETLMDLSMSLRVLVMSVARYAIEHRGGSVQINLLSFELNCTGIPHSEQIACRKEVDKLVTSLQHSMVFHLDKLELNVSPS